MTELIEKLVIQWLPEATVEFLTQKCTELAVNIPNDKADNQQYLVRLVSRHLYSAELENSQDQGKAVWLKLFGELGTALGKGAAKQEPTQPLVQGTRFILRVTPCVQVFWGQKMKLVF